MSPEPRLEYTVDYTSSHYKHFEKNLTQHNKLVSYQQKVQHCSGWRANLLTTMIVLRPAKKSNMYLCSA